MSRSILGPVVTNHPTKSYIHTAPQGGLGRMDTMPALKMVTETGPALKIMLEQNRSRLGFHQRRNQQPPCSPEGSSTRSPPALPILVGVCLAWNDIGAFQPATEVDIGAALRTEGTVFLRPRLAADRATRTTRGARAVFNALPIVALAGCHTASTSARFNQLKYTGKPSPDKRLTTSIKGNPTTLE